MNIKNTLTLAVLLMTSMIASSQTPQSIVGFQDIPWGSSAQAVKSKFPQLKAWNACKNNVSISEADAIAAFKRLDKNCVTYSIEKYAIENHDFNLVFSFSYAGKLNSVSIEKYVEGIPPVSTPACQAHYSRLKELLVNKYGAGRTPNPDDDLYGFKALGFRNHDAQYWVLGPTQIYLSNSWNNQKLVDLCWVNLSYTPFKMLDSSKL